MKLHVNITDRAAKDIQEVVDYIEFRLLNKQAADNLLLKAQTEISALSTTAYSHRLVDDPILNVVGIRYVMVNNYMAFYIIDERTNDVNVIRFLYGKRNWMNILKNVFPVS